MNLLKKSFFVIFLLLTSVLYAQESIIKSYASEHGANTLMRSFCLYPSTLRMINLQENDRYNHLVNSVEKLLIFRLDAAQKNLQQPWVQAYKEEGYEDFLTLTGATSVTLLGNEASYVGSFRGDDMQVIFYLKGKIVMEELVHFLMNKEEISFIDSFNNIFNERDINNQ